MYFSNVKRAWFSETLITRIFLHPTGRWSVIGFLMTLRSLADESDALMENLWRSWTIKPKNKMKTYVYIVDNQKFFMCKNRDWIWLIIRDDQYETLVITVKMYSVLVIGAKNHNNTYFARNKRTCCSRVILGVCLIL